MVDSKQAEALQLATTHGSISLAMRNPLDKKIVAIGATVLSQDRLAKLGSLLRPTVFTAGEEGGGPDEQLSEEDTAKQTGGEVELLKAGLGGEAAVPKSPQWEVTVIRGSEVKDEVLEVESGGVAGEAEEEK